MIFENFANVFRRERVFLDLCRVIGGGVMGGESLAVGIALVLEFRPSF